MNNKTAIKRRNRKQLREFRRKALKDLLYFLLCGLIFTGLVQGSSAAVNGIFHKAADTLADKPAAKVFAETPQLTPVPVKQAENWQDFINSAMKIAPIYNYPVKLLLAQAALESNRGLSNYAKQRNNYFGMNAVDWNPDAAYWYENQEQSIVDYLITIRANFPEAWQHRDNPELMLQLMQRNDSGTIYASDPAYVQKVMNQPEWRNY